MSGIPMLTREELEDEITKDSKVDRTQIALEIHRSTELLGKYLKYHMMFKAAVIRGESILNQKIRDASLYYEGKADPQVYKNKPFNFTLTNQSQRDKFIDSDEECCKYREHVDLANECLYLCENMIQELRYRPRHLETVHNIRVFESGS